MNAKDHMDSSGVNEWQRFCRTGSVRAYLRYKGVSAEEPSGEGRAKEPPRGNKGEE